MDRPADNRVLVLGAAGHAGHVIDVIETEGKYQIHGLVESKPAWPQTHGYRVIGVDSELSRICSEERIDKAIVAIGDNWTRRRVMQSVKACVPDISFITSVHPAAILSKKVKVGAGTVISPGSVVNNNVTIGEGCVVGTGSVIEHDVTLGDYSSVLSAAALAGGVRLGHCSVVGLGSNVAHKVTIGSYCVVGAGSLVLKDMPDSVVAYGRPAEVIRSRDHDEAYL